MSNANDFHSYNVIYIVYDRKNENHWSLLSICYSLLGTETHVFFAYMFSCINKILLTFCTDVTVEEFFVHAVNIFIVNQRKDVFS